MINIVRLVVRTLDRDYVTLVIPGLSSLHINASHILFQVYKDFIHCRLLSHSRENPLCPSIVRRGLSVFTE